ncbi:hypothetical protein [Crateriforma conspicua]|uniref:Uncharacterized protein n=1 Tax=Crateriforma conspicua TaxID=2527996 RepID=A0A5C5YAE9_9PLAN|nr:hypothetical protein [Crateriforma conspicua]TWT72657.1 hypothetical protein Pan14r_49770 [Crateriforma conspicua]
MLALDDSRWQSLRHAGGSAERFPQLLHRVQQVVDNDQEDLSDRELESLWDICHQWTTYDATVAAIPHLLMLAVAASPNRPIRKRLIQLISASITGIKSDGTTASSEIQRHFEHSLAHARSLAIDSIPFTETRDELCCLFAIIAATGDDTELAGAMLELDQNSLQCQHCFNFIQPVGGLNPFGSSTGK